MNGDDIDIQALAKLARLEVSSEELQKLVSEIPTILASVETIQKVDISGVVAEKSIHNVLRLDENAHESGEYTEKILAAAPTREGNHIAVKQVVSRRVK